MAGRPKGTTKIKVDNALCKQVQKMAGHGMTLRQICDILDISQDTLERRRHEITSLQRAVERGQAMAQEVIAQTLFQQAKNGNIAALIWWEKTRAGKTEKQKVELSLPIEEILNALPPEFSKEVRKAIIEARPLDQDKTY